MVVRAVQAPVAPMEMLEARSILRFVRGSPNKMRRVLDTIRGKTYEDALKTLTFMPYKCALLVRRDECPEPIAPSTYVRCRWPVARSNLFC